HDLFWSSHQDRARTIECSKFDVVFLKDIICRRLSATLSAQISREVKRGDATAVSILVNIATEHRLWLDLASSLRLVEQQHIRTGYVSLGAIHDRISGMSGRAGHSVIRSSLAEREVELSAIVKEF